MMLHVQEDTKIYNNAVRTLNSTVTCS